MPATSDSRAAAEPVGAVFTPAPWARFCLEKFKVVEDWLSGASVCDPTAGEGAFLLACCEAARLRGREIRPEDAARLFACDKQPAFLESFRRRFEHQVGFAFPPDNLRVADIALAPPELSVDWLVGNPPWANFTDLPEEDKEGLKHAFLRSGLCPDRRRLLLGSARIDLAALIVVNALQAMLRAQGKAAFYLPLSLFLNEGAHRGFRSYCLPAGDRFAVQEIYDFDRERIFEGIHTRFCLSLLAKGTPPRFPVRYWVRSSSDWAEHQATPFPEDHSPLVLHACGTTIETAVKGERPRIRWAQRPRQGVNTCGANDVFLFEEPPPELPSALIYPLVTKACFQSRQEGFIPERFVFLPHDRITGKPLSGDTLRRDHPGAWEYLARHRDRLLARKGALLGSWLKRGDFWACLGVGPYSFTPFKILWRAYGADEFEPIILSSMAGQAWQGNQALHAFIPCREEQEALRIQAELLRSPVRALLAASRTQGTRSWAQPGKISSMLDFVDEPSQASRANQRQGLLVFSRSGAPGSESNQDAR